MLNKGNERPRIRQDLDKQHSSESTWDDHWLSVWACIDNKWHFVIHNLAVKAAPAAEPVFFCRRNVEIARRGRCDIHLNYGPSGAMNYSFIYAWGEKVSKQRGFSLIELLIVVAIILIIAAIAIPNLLRARIAANESASVSAIRTINTAEVTYATTFPTKGYSDTLAALGGTPAACATPAVANACLIDNVLASATATPGKSGYKFAVTPVATGTINTAYTVGASPLTYNQSGVRNFCSNEDGVIRFNAGAAASAPVTTNGACVAFTVLP